MWEENEMRVDERNDEKMMETKELLYAATLKLLESSREKIFIKDKDLVYRGASRKFAKMAGWETEKDLFGKTDFEIFEDQELAQRYRNDDLRLIENSHDLIDYIEPIVGTNGNARFASTSKYVLRDENGNFMGLAGVSRDVTQEYYSKRHSNKALEYLFDLPKDAYFAAYLDLDEWRIVNENHQQVKGRAFRVHSNVDRLIGNAYERIADRRWPAANFYRTFSREAIHELYLSGKTEIQMEYRRIVSENEMLWVRDELHLLEDNVSGHLCMMLVVRDIHEAKIQEEEQMRNAERDDLTGLLTRKATMQLIRHSLENSLLYDRHALLMIDMDHFKAINDTYGHPAGDQALVDTANVIRENFRSSDIVGRIGGDEFFVLMTHVPDRATVEKKAISLVEKLNRVHYADIYLSASVGISVYPEDAGDLDMMYAKADKAMYEAKKARNAYVFAEDMTSEASK